MITSRLAVLLLILVIHAGCRRPETAGFLYPGDGAENVDVSRPFQWSEVPGAEAYYLYVGRHRGSMDLHDSGETRLTSRVVTNLPGDERLFARISTRIRGVWRHKDISFTVDESRSASNFDVKLERALKLTSEVRGMADDRNIPVPGTPLHELVAERGRERALCADYSELLTQLIRIGDVGNVRRINVAFNSNGFDGHTLVEMYNPKERKWMLLDPTFNCTVRLTADGAFATARDVSEAAHSMDWQAISYVFLGEAGDRLAREYYIDYPLLFLNIYPRGTSFVKGTGFSPLPYLEPVQLPRTGPKDWYVLRNFSGAPATVMADGKRKSLDCDGIGGLSQVVEAHSFDIVSSPGGPTQPYRLQRYVFYAETR